MIYIPSPKNEDVGLIKLAPLQDKDLPIAPDLLKIKFQVPLFKIDRKVLGLPNSPEALIVRLRQPDLRSLQVPLRLLVRCSDSQNFHRLANKSLLLEILSIRY
jgi:hypothetical protein